MVKVKLRIIFQFGEPKQKMKKKEKRSREQIKNQPKMNGPKRVFFSFFLKGKITHGAKASSTLGLIEHHQNIFVALRLLQIK